VASVGDTLVSRVGAAKKSGLRAGRYELLTRLAAGGMGEVFIARVVGEGDFEKKVALKLLLPHLTSESEFVHMFLDEARIAARMNHPNIVQIFDLGEADGRYFIAMALVEGVSLSRLLKACRARNEHLPMPLLRLIAAGLCTGLAYAHEKGIVHRDVNPSNILVSTAGAVLLTDFGIAKAQGNLHRTRPGDVKGKFAYMAPEQMAGTFDHRTDLFAAAVTLYEALTLVSPFSRATDPETIDAIRTSSLPDASAARPDATKNWVMGLRKGIARAAAERFSSALTMRDALSDGAIAAPHELGEWVERLCPDELKPFGGEAWPPHEHAGTRSMAQAGTKISSVPTDPHAVLAPRRWPWVFAASAALATIAVIAVLKSEQRPKLAPLPPDPVVDLAPVVVAQPPPPEPEPEPVEAKPRPVRKEKEKERAPDPMRIGYLTADAVPWARLVVDGKEFETTPLSRYPMKVGKYTLVFTHPDSGKEITRKVTIEEGKTVTVRVDFTQ
jgi:serine/threonine protein kinase